MKDLGVLKYFLGLEVARNLDGFYLCERKYFMDIVTETGMLGCKPIGFPIEQKHRLALATGALLPDPERYRRLVGHLVYLAATRPDVAYSIHLLSQFMREPREEHWTAALHVVRYLEGTLGQSILLRAASSLHVTGWSDSDWAVCPMTQYLVSGWIVQLGSSPISWKTKKQDTVFLSSTEAEYRAMTELLRELKWSKHSFSNSVSLLPDR